MTEEKAFLVINAFPEPENMAGFQMYLSKIMPILEDAGRNSLGRYRTVEQVMGEGGPRISAVVEFPSAEVIKNMIEGEEFNSLSQLRAEAFKKLDLMICQVF